MAINAIHLDHMPIFDYDKLLWGERQIRSVANMTRQDARDFLKIAHDLHIRPQVTVFPRAVCDYRHTSQAVGTKAFKTTTYRTNVIIVILPRSLDLFQGASFGFGNDPQAEQQSGDTHCGVEPEC